MDDLLVQGGDGRMRCAWNIRNAHWRVYHDDRYGRPTADDGYLFEKLCLEIFASGMSFVNVLGMRDALAGAFRGFDPARVARMGEADVARLMGKDGVVRNERKIRAVIHNAGAACDLMERERLGPWLWSFAPAAEDVPVHRSFEDVARAGPTAESEEMAKALKEAGFAFVGPTVCYGIMQGSGMVNDHLEGCYCRAEAAVQRAAFDPSA